MGPLVHNELSTRLSLNQQLWLSEIYAIAQEHGCNAGFNVVFDGVVAVVSTHHEIHKLARAALGENPPFQPKGQPSTVVLVSCVAG
jgi:hypothetical protein